MINFQEVNTCTAVDFRVRVLELDDAIEYLTSMGSKYSIEPHVTLLLNPSSEEGFHAALGELREYLSGLEPFEISLDQFGYEEKARFLKVEVVAAIVKKIHLKLLEIVGKYRNGEIRKKDLLRIDQGKYSDEEIEHLRKHGFVFCADRFSQKITLGTIPELVGVAAVKDKVKQMVSPVLGKKMIISEINLMFHTDAPTQAEMKELEFETIQLS